MAIGHVELQGGIQRLQDFSAIRHNEENRPTMEQAQSAIDFRQEVNTQAERVADSRDTDPDGAGLNGEGRGNARYRGDGGKRRRSAEEKKEKAQSDGKVFIKASPGDQWHPIKGGDFSITV